jgi:hypothetical protein
MKTAISIAMFLVLSATVHAQCPSCASGLEKGEGTSADTMAIAGDSIHRLGSLCPCQTIRPDTGLSRSGPTTRVSSGIISEVMIFRQSSTHAGVT